MNISKRAVLTTLLIFFLIIFAATLAILSSKHAEAGNAPVKYNSPLCGKTVFPPCPVILFYSRDYPAATAKVLAVYSPGAPIPRDPQHPNYACSYNTRTQWRIGHPKDGVSGFSATDWQDINIIKAKPTVATNWRWGDCCPSDPNNAVCLE